MSENNQPQTIGWLGLRDYSSYFLEMFKEAGIEEEADSEAWIDISKCAAGLLSDAWGGGEKPSPFKIMAAFIIALVEHAPLPEVLPEDVTAKLNFDPSIARYPKAFIAAVAFEMAREYLCGSKVGNAKNLKPLPQRISVSGHFYRDLIFTVAIGAHVGELALILEAVAYQTNPDAQNGDRV